MEKSYYKDFFILEKEHWFFRARKNIILYFYKKTLKSRQSDFDVKTGFSGTLLYHIINFEIYFLKYIYFPFGVFILFIIKKSHNENH